MHTAIKYGSIKRFNTCAIPARGLIIAQSLVSGTNTVMATPDDTIVAHASQQAELAFLRQRVYELEQEIQTLNELVRTDGLTGLYNQRFFREALHRECERTQRSGEDFCLVLIDLDHFKKVNDSWGHEAGNVALKRTAKLIREIIRPTDLPCRYGGEEFAVLLPGTPLMISVQVAERIRSTIAGSEIVIDNKTLTLTASFGVCAYQRNSVLSQEQLIETADQQLYRAKREGRNKVCYQPAKSHKKQQVSQSEKDMLSGLFNDSDD